MLTWSFSGQKGLENGGWSLATSRINELGDLWDFLTGAGELAKAETDWFDLITNQNKLVLYSLNS